MLRNVLSCSLLAFLCSKDLPLGMFLKTLRPWVLPRRQKLHHAYQVVHGSGESKKPIDSRTSAQLGLAQTRHVLDPGEHFLYPPTDSLSAGEAPTLPLRRVQPIFPILP